MQHEYRRVTGLDSIYSIAATKYPSKRNEEHFIETILTLFPAEPGFILCLEYALDSDQLASDEAV